MSHICCSCLRYLECLFCLPVLGYLQANMCTIVISVFIVFIISCPFFALRFWQRSLGFLSHTVLHPVEWQYLCLAFFWSSMTLLVLCMRFGLLIWNSYANNINILHSIRQMHSCPWLAALRLPGLRSPSRSSASFLASSFWRTFTFWFCW